MYEFKDGCDQKHFFWWPKKVIENKNWAMLPAASKAIWPVIACHCDKKGSAFPGERRIGILAGRSDKYVRAGISGLKAFPGFKVEDYNTLHGRRSKKFHIELPPKNNNDCFPFFKFLLDSGAWRELNPSAQALYPVMRYFGFFDLDFYNEMENDSVEVSDLAELYKNRKFDYCHAEKKTMIEFSGIGERSIYRAICSLTELPLIEQIDYETYRIFLHSKDHLFFKRSYLNQKIIDAYRHVLQK